MGCSSQEVGRAANVDRSLNLCTASKAAAQLTGIDVLDYCRGSRGCLRTRECRCSGVGSQKFRLRRVQRVSIAADVETEGLVKVFGIIERRHAHRKAVDGVDRPDPGTAGQIAQARCKRYKKSELKSRNYRR